MTTEAVPDVFASETPSWSALVSLTKIPQADPSPLTSSAPQEYFSKSAGPVKRVILTYNQNGTSRGIASIIFRQPESAAKAAKDLNGMLVDKKPIKIEVVVDPTKVPTAVPTSRSLAQRASQPKPAQQPKSAARNNTNANNNNNNNTSSAGGRRGGRGGRGGRSGRPKPKTAEELDQEMTDYFVQSGVGAAAAGPGDAAIDVNGAQVQQVQATTQAGAPVAAVAAAAAPAPAAQAGALDMGMDDI
ncbi:hypothetical protein KEM52_005203 [Ascosphaera acerosa]|nr:hypothetical protein KEM52_005203 [Ascosphaera acerosa]